MVTTVVKEFILDLEQSLQDYETSRPGGKKPSKLRSQDLNEFYTMFEQATSAVYLRQQIEQKMRDMKVGSFSGMALLDLNALRVRLNWTLKKEKFSYTSLLIRENQEHRDREILFAAKITTLEGKLKSDVCDSQEFKELSSNVAQLNKRLELLQEELEHTKTENIHLIKANQDLIQAFEQYKAETTVDKVRYEAEIDLAKRQYSQLNDKYLALLQEKNNLQQEKIVPQLPAPAKPQEQKKGRFFGF